MARHQHRHALLLLLLVNSVALASGVAVAQGAVPLAPPSPVPLAAPAPTPSEVLLPLGPPPEADVHPRRPAPAPPISPAPPAARPASPTPKIHPAPRPRRAPAATRRARPSFRQDLDRQIARIPLYKPALVRWVVVPDLAVYGVTSLRTSTIYVSPRIPRKLLYSVVAHEWGHVISTHAYGGDLRASQQAFKEWFGASSMRTGTERAADCIAALLGATWTHYTSCRNQHWRLGALYLANGMKLPVE